MNKDRAVSVRGRSPIYRTLLAFIIFCSLFQGALAAGVVDVTTHIDKTGATPFQIWAVMAIVGPALVLLTLRARLAPAELEADFVMSVAAWIPIAFTAYSSFAVDRIVSSFMTSTGGIVENHVIYHFDLFGYGYAVLLLIAVLNTVRIITLHNKLQFQPESSKGW